MMGPLNPKQFHSRIWGVVLVLALLLTFLCSNLYSIQYTNGPEYAAQAVARVAEVEDVPTSRGLILDRNGKVLVSNEISYQVTLDMSRMGEPEERCANLLSLIQVAREEGVACVVEDVRTGEILASASYPTYSLPDFRKDYNSLLDDPLKPLNNRAFSGLYPPGSTFKMISAIAGLEEEIITPSTIIRDEGQYTYWPTPQPKCWIYRQYGRTHGPVNVSDAIEVSCNYFFYDVGRRVGIEKLDEYAAKFGLGQKTGVELSEAAGVVASPEFTESLGGKWYEGNVLSVAIGQESTQVTPIQLANYISTLANGGTRYTTHLLKTVKSGDFSQVSYAAEPEVAGTVEMKPENLAAVTRGMHSMTTGEGSLARVFQDVPVQVAAKTGSAQVNGQSNSNAVFVCYAPYDDPQIAISIAVEKGGSGSSLASIAAEILQYYFTAQDGQGQLPAENTLVP